MRLLKSNPLLALYNSYVVDSPQPANISYAWNFGSLLALCLGIQIVTGIILAMHYTPNVDLAFVSVEHIMRDVNYGWMIRYIHANVASFFFIFVYLHIGRGLYYGSYKSPRVLPWSIGVIILVLMMATAFLGFLISLKWFIYFELSTYDYLLLLPTASFSRLQVILDKHGLKPVAVWENLGIEGMKTQITRIINRINGVYAIINLVTGEVYVGSAILGRMGMRFYKHLFGGQGSKNVWAAVSVHGLDNFAFVVLSATEYSDTEEGNSDLLAMEDHFIDLIKPAYNVLQQASNSFGYKHTDETKAHMKAIYSSERREAIGSLNRGKNFLKKLLNGFVKQLLTVVV
jgi:hypothetical protein